MTQEDTKINKYDSESTKIIKNALQMGIPVRYTYIDSNGKVKSIIDFVSDLAASNLLMFDIYNQLIQMNYNINPEDFVYLYVLTFDLKEISYSLEDMILHINFFYD